MRRLRQSADNRGTAKRLLEINGERVRPDGEFTVRFAEDVKMASLELLVVERLLVAESLLVVALVMSGHGRNGLGRAENWVNARLRTVEGSLVCLRSIDEQISDHVTNGQTIWLLLMFSPLRLCKCPIATGST
ncbi:MAG: hypothetical protein TREMPRED_005874, partial [Tremellales sp. Tagirdzhanova-0007]